MFGDLFNEEYSVDGIFGPKINIQTPAPISPRPSCKFAGIENQGATCYLNSLVQTLLLTPEFKEKLFQLSEKDLGCIDDRDKPGAKVRVIPIQLQRLFAQLLLSDQKSVSTLDLTNSFGWTNQEGFQQHDVQELNRILFCAIEDSLVGTAGENVINELYRGTIVNQIKCTRCKKISERKEDFLDLTLATGGIPGVEAALKSSYCDVEVMNGRNQYRCETCGMLTDATKGAKLRNLPPILTISLLRFSYDFVKMSRYKENGRFTFPMQLDMSAYCDKKCSSSKDELYDLFSVVVHRGGAYGGHYFAYIRDIDNLGHWSQQESKKHQNKKDLSSTGLDIIECESPLDLIQNILSKQPHQAMSIERLCVEISKVTGVSWNKRFKKSHGPINKFLKSNDMFCYNPDSSWVSLANSGSDSTTSTEGSSQKSQEADQSNNKDSASVPNDQSTEILESSPDHHWFCFNDSNVSPIHAKEIEQQFSGKESAYMLFYRRSSLERPNEAKGHAEFCVPDRLKTEMDVINENLAKERTEHDCVINSITLKIFEAGQFIYRELLHLKPTEREGPQHKDLKFDKRKTIAELRTSIREVLEDKNVQNFNIHRMKEWCGGYYLCDELKDETVVLQDLDMLHDTSLFIWNGIVVDDQFVEEGPNHEPIKLLVLDETDQHPVGEIVLRKSRSLHHLYQAVADMAGLNAYSFTIHTGLQTDVNSPDSAHLLTSDSQQSLTDAGLSNDDVLILSGSDGNIEFQNLSQDTSQKCSPVTEESEWFMVIQETLSEEMGGKEINLKVKPTLGLKDLKIQAMEAFSIDDVPIENVRLRELHRSMGLQPPLREGLSIVDSGLSNGMTLILESGRSPEDSEMTINVNKVVSGKLVSRREFLVDRQLTVIGLIQAACKLMNCEGTQWYLSKTDIYGDPADPLDNDSSSLIDNFINDGDALVLQEGTVIRKDQVSVNVWLHTDKEESLTHGSTGPGESGDNPLVNGEKEEDKIILELAAKLSLNESVNPKDLNPLNKCLCPSLEQLFDKSLVVGKAMSVEEFKLALMGTECFQMLRIPTSNFMRLRIVDGQRLRAVVRNNSQVLRHVNAKEFLNIAIQILPCEENLSNQELLLNVAQKIGGSRIYMPAKEFIWNTSGGQGATDLRKAVALKLGLPLHDVSIAKFNPDTFQWTLLKDTPQKQGKGKGKKKSGSGKCNIRHAPYNVQDGDLIGVKVISTDKGILEADDFSTQEDIDNRLILQQIAEEKRRMREEKKNDHWLDNITTNTKSSNKRREVPLTIKVDKFS